MIKKIINFLEKGDFCLRVWLVSFSALISTRLLVESLLLGLELKKLESFIALFCHTFLFFILTYFVFLIFVYFLTKEKITKITNFLLWGFVIIIFPPIIDKLIFQGDVYKSFYIFDGFKGLVVRFFTFFGSNPDWGITWGTRINILISIICLAVYVYFKTKNKTKLIISIIGSYGLFFVLSCFPSLVVLGIELFKTGSFLEVNYSTVAGYFMTPLNSFGLSGVATESFLARKLALIYLLLIFGLLFLFCFGINFKKTLSLVKNIRLPQIIFNVGLLFIGMGIGGFYKNELLEIDFFNLIVVFNLILIVVVSWIFSVVSNDFYDLEIDKISNKQRPLVKKIITPREYSDYGLLLFLFSVFGSILINPLFLLIILSYHFLTFIYSAYPFRLRRFLGIANILIAFSSLLFLILGYQVFFVKEGLINFPWEIYWFLFAAYFFIIPLKDLKDIKGDKKNKIISMPVLLGENNTRLIIAGLVFSFYLVSVYVLKNPNLFLPALILGTISYFIINNKEITNQNLNHWVLGLVFLYGLILIRVVF